MKGLRFVWQQWALTAGVTLFGLELIRLLFPTFVYYLRDAQGMSPVTLAPIAIGVFALSFLAWPLSRLDVPLALILTAGGVALFRVLVQIFASPVGNLFLGSVGVALFLMYLPLALSHALAGDKQEVAHFGLALLLGVTLSTAVNSALKSYDLVWQRGFLPLLAVIVLALVIVAALRKHFNSSGPLESFDLPWRRALPLVALGPWLFLQIVVFQNVARFGAVSGWPLPAAGLMVTFGNVLGLTLAVVVMRRGTGGLVSVLVMGLLLVATLFFSETRAFPAGLLPSLGQVLSFGLLTAVLLNLGKATASGSIGRVGVANGIAQLLLVILSFAYYVSYDISIGFRSATVLPVAGVFFVIGVLAAVGNKEGLAVQEMGYTAVIAGAVLLVLPLSTWLGWQSLEVVEMPDSSEPVIVMDFNVHNGFNRAGQLDLEAIAQVIEESGAGIVGLQEVSRGWVINGSADMAQWLSQRLGMSYYFASTEGELWGNMILSRYPIVRTDHVAYSTESLLLRRGYLVAEIDTGQSILEVTVTHLHHRADGSDVRQVQAAEVLDGRVTSNGLLMGDMNAIPDTPEMALLNRGSWVDVLSEVEPESARYTNSVDAPYRQIDYIWVTPDVAFSEPFVIQTMVSDHFPVVVRLGEG